jgi:hypothetical protein
MKPVIECDEKTRLAIIAALAEEIAPPVLKRLMKKRGPGKGDYSKERHELFKNVTSQEIERDLLLLAAKRKKSKP